MDFRSALVNSSVTVDPAEVVRLESLALRLAKLIECSPDFPDCRAVAAADLNQRPVGFVGASRELYDSQ